MYELVSYDPSYINKNAFSFDANNVRNPQVKKIVRSIDNLFGGSADLEPSNVTAGFAEVVGDFSYDNQKGRN